MSTQIASGAVEPVLLQLPGWLPDSQTVVADFVIPAALFVVTLIAVSLVGRAVLVPLVGRVLDRRGHDATVKSLAESVAGATVWLLAVAVAFTVAGFGEVIAAFGVFAGAVALAVGFAAQDLLGNFVAGIFILKDRPFEVGDWIEQGDVVGRVEDVDLRVTRIRTFDNERITVPNGGLANNPLKNPVAYDTLRQTFVFGIGYDDDIDHATEVILDEAARTEGILDDPEPSVRVVELADSYVGLQARFWIADPGRADFARIRSDFVQAVKERCDAEAIEMPYPFRELTGSVEIGGDLDASRTETPADD
ncbi:mechanosensitive ion channel family protein [Halegenticoccus tardaugens]|uniref:mechanosensitive ion channel family protein n=1 Tax=Halegenticoccus tardaugens TaxID=2071624 RepID=UPI00100C11A7|nr:mechanosensitive ion channel family protein [Halegenticoccus tardaugens]